MLGIASTWHTSGNGCEFEMMSESGPRGLLRTRTGEGERSGGGVARIAAGAECHGSSLAGGSALSIRFGDVGESISYGRSVGSLTTSARLAVNSYWSCRNLCLPLRQKSCQYT